PRLARCRSHQGLDLLVRLPEAAAGDGLEADGRLAVRLPAQLTLQGELGGGKGEESFRTCLGKSGPPQNRVQPAHQRRISSSSRLRWASRRSRDGWVEKSSASPSPPTAGAMKKAFIASASRRSRWGATFMRPLILMRADARC